MNITINGSVFNHTILSMSLKQGLEVLKRRPWMLESFGPLMQRGSTESAHCRGRSRNVEEGGAQALSHAPTLPSPSHHTSHSKSHTLTPSHTLTSQPHTASHSQPHTPSHSL